MQTIILGKGAFGRALGSLLQENEVSFSYVDISLPLDHKADVVFISVPISAYRNALTENKSFFHKDTIFINCSKGIEPGTHQLPFQIVSEVLNTPHYLNLIGPSFAIEIEQKNPTLVSLGYTNSSQAKKVKKLVQTAYFTILETSDFKGVELSAALKNVYAILCGYCDGLGFGMNTKAKLIVLALQEIADLAKAMHFDPSHLTTPGMMGDLVLTCSSSESRNYTFGYLLATKGYAEAKAISESTVEGLATVKSVAYLSEKYHCPLPLSLKVADLIQKKQTSHQFSSFLSSLA